MIFIFFFFQAEDGIRDVAVTGVQTCALPISLWDPGKSSFQVLQVVAYKVASSHVEKAHVNPLSKIAQKRSEEHTSELQSRLHLVCRLLLEKKKKKRQPEPTARHSL